MVEQEVEINQTWRNKRNKLQKSGATKVNSQIIYIFFFFYTQKIFFSFGKSMEGLEAMSGFTANGSFIGDVPSFPLC